MDNQEPQLTQISNLEMLHSGHKLPEQSQTPNGFNVNPTSFSDLIHQWQPMGIRVTLNLPFTGNDKDFLFAIRNGPFIPQFDYSYTDYQNKRATGADPPTNVLIPINEYAYNNMMPVTYAYSQAQSIDPNQSAIYITHYDQPPPLASFSTMFRKWRGTMHYRIRVVAGFTTQGYVFTTMYRNVRRGPMVVNRAKYAASVVGQDSSYRQGMVNSYVMGDTAMFRHFEIQVPFEYPQPYYDQFNWIANRTRPHLIFRSTNDPSRTTTISSIYNEPFGDNFILFGLRGKLESSVSGSQISFELEYRAGDDFQFSDPFLPIDNLILKLTSKSNKDTITSPSNSWSSNGFFAQKNLVAASDKKDEPDETVIPANEMTEKLLAIKQQELIKQQEEAAIRQRELEEREARIRQIEEQERERARRTQEAQRTATASRARKPRSLDEDGLDTVDPAFEEMKPLRKSLRDVLQF